MIANVEVFDEMIMAHCHECGAIPGALCKTDVIGEFTAFPVRFEWWIEFASLHVSRGRP